MNLNPISRGAEVFDISFDSSVLDFEIETRIPGKDLVSIIWDFYQKMGHERIRLEALTSKRKSRYIFHKPDFKKDDIYAVQKITVYTNKRKNKQKFDAIEFAFEGLDPKQIRIKANFMVLTPLWLYVGIALSLLASFISIDLFHVYWRLGRLIIATFAYSLVFFPIYFITRYISFNKKQTIKKQSNIARYKREFEEHIRQKEMFSEYH